jgi:hypothetical protein
MEEIINKTEFYWGYLEEGQLIVRRNSEANIKMDLAVTRREYVNWIMCITLCSDGLVCTW